MARNAEARIQAAIITYVRTVAPDVLIFHVPNGGLRSKSEAARMKWQGVVPGIPDLVLIGPGGRAYFLEVKTQEGRLSKAQSMMFWRLRGLHAHCHIVRSIDDVQAVLHAWGIASRQAEAAA